MLKRRLQDASDRLAAALRQVSQLRKQARQQEVRRASGSVDTSMPGDPSRSQWAFGWTQPAQLVAWIVLAAAVLAVWAGLL